MGDESYEQGTYLDTIEEAQAWVGVTFGSESKVSVKVPHLDGEFELSPHEVHEWLESHGFRPTASQRSEVDALVNAAIERGRQRAAGGGGDSAPPRDTELVGYWQQFQGAIRSLQGASSGDDRGAIFQAVSSALGAMNTIDSRSGGGRPCDTEMQAWGRHAWSPNEWTLDSAQAAGQAIASYGDSVAGWATIQHDVRNAEVIALQHQFLDYCTEVRQQVRPVETWSTAQES